MEGFVLWDSYFCWREGGDAQLTGVDYVCVCVYGEGWEERAERSLNSTLCMYALYALSMNRRDIVV